jgi:hypothetical protein
MAFFLTGYPSRLPLASRRGDLGLHDGDGLGTARFIAVEFDTYRDSLRHRRPYRHRHQYCQGLDEHHMLA